MTLQLSPELTAAVQSFLAGGRYKDEADVVRRALAELKRSESDVADIEAGFAEDAQRLSQPARDVVHSARSRLHGRLGSASTRL
jgi:Arc/MetJ-type ribon-helix-helix transcriptional regulator